MNKTKNGAWLLRHPKAADGWAVGYTRKAPPKSDYGDYHGPVAQVSYDGTWLHIVTDNYEGHAMLNIQTLQPLRKVLAEIARERKKQARLDGAEGHAKAPSASAAQKASSHEGEVGRG